MDNSIFEWSKLIFFAISSIAMSLIGVILAFRKLSAKKVALFIGIGILILLVFIIGFWSNIQRPPFLTIGETRLWYSLFLLIIGLITWFKTRYNYVLLVSIIMSSVFLIINILKPQIHSINLAPVLQSIWFVPHVSVYMFAYSLIACATIISLIELIKNNHSNKNAINTCDNLVTQGIALLTMGMVMGAIWAKQAWGDYWSWDLKEIWAAITWLWGLGYLHFRKLSKQNNKIAYYLIIILFLLFQMCWWGINFLPAAKNSIHSY